MLVPNPSLEKHEEHLGRDKVSENRITRRANSLQSFLHSGQLHHPHSQQLQQDHADQQKDFLPPAIQGGRNVGKGLDLTTDPRKKSGCTKNKISGVCKG